MATFFHLPDKLLLILVVVVPGCVSDGLFVSPCPDLLCLNPDVVTSQRAGHMPTVSSTVCVNNVCLFQAVQRSTGSEVMVYETSQILILCTEWHPIPYTVRTTFDQGCIGNREPFYTKPNSPSETEEEEVL
jgi:hypothetical protein